MKRILGVLGATLFIACATSNRLPASEHSQGSTHETLLPAEKPTDESDEDIACRFAPAILNEMSVEHGYTNRGYNLPIHLAYDVSQTDSHVFITYSVIKSFSEFPLLANRGADKAWFSNAPHVLDTEDVFVVLQKDHEKGPVPVLFSTNAHGRRLDYFNLTGGRLSLKEVNAADSERLRLEGRELNSWGFTKAGSKFMGFINHPESVDGMDGDGPYQTNFWGETPLLYSRSFDHALSGASRQVIEHHPELFTNGDFIVSVSRCSNKSKQDLIDLNLPVQQYKLVPIAEVYSKIYVSKEMQARNPRAKLKVQRKPVLLNGQEVETPAYPIYVDPKIYMQVYAPDLMDALKKDLGEKKFNKYLYDDINPLHFTQDPDDKATLRLRVDPVAFFQSRYPETFKLQKGSTNYTRFDALKIRFNRDPDGN